MAKESEVHKDSEDLIKIEESEESEVGNEPELHKSETEREECDEEKEVASEKTRQVKELHLKQRRQLYTNKEHALIRSFFRRNIESKTTPSLKSCRVHCTTPHKTQC